MKEKMMAIVDAQKYCVISTSDLNGAPESALVAYSSNKEREIMFATSSKSRKYKNLLQNSSVSIVISDNQVEVQYEGKAEILETKDADLAANIHIIKHPNSVKYRYEPTQKYIKVKPLWLRYVEYGDRVFTEEFTEFK